ncbi:hypothetical protein B4102_3710 [Heyndrickxia sporothermodurans]|uniref:Uncharacterized protein n=1 Tax=Heyndrickxia sporothermodurans TaxID=46224 RepID=A0A150KLK2_9BACI|nr:hypothetical protein B4102_3710 [Heyndrickxia sporothermodurans]
MIGNERMHIDRILNDEPKIGFLKIGVRRLNETKGCLKKHL